VTTMFLIAALTLTLADIRHLVSINDAQISYDGSVTTILWSWSFGTAARRAPSWNSLPGAPMECSLPTRSNDDRGGRCLERRDSKERSRH
jgi:hypothetical protein